MKSIHIVALVAAIGAATACDRQPAANRTAADDQVVGTPTAQVYSGTGTVQSISGDQVTIAHGPIEGLGWPAMTMTFRAPPAMAQGVSPGAQVDFSFRQDGSSYTLTSLRPR